jgi:protein arginine kinase activator
MSNVCPLTNKPCYQKKVYHITDIIGGKTQSVDLCPLCFQTYIQDYEKHHVKFLGKDSIMDEKELFKKVTQEEFVKKLLTLTEKLLNEKSKIYEQKENIQRCPHCQWSEKDIIEKGKMGCPHCYDFYKKGLQQVLFQAHGTPNSPEELKHVGKVPKNFKNKDKKEDKKLSLIKLKYKLQKAIEIEDYETAAKLRDEIIKISGEAKSDP